LDKHIDREECDMYWQEEECRAPEEYRSTCEKRKNELGTYQIHNSSRIFKLV
jgi:hypothetical protein